MREEDRPTSRTNPKLLRWGKVTLMVITGALLVSHILKWDVVQVDSITLGVIGLLLLIPFADLIRKIKLGEFEAEIGETRSPKCRQKRRPSCLHHRRLNSTLLKRKSVNCCRATPVWPWLEIRIELEEALKRLYSATT